MAAFSGLLGSVTVHVAGNAEVTGRITEWSFEGSMSPVETTQYGEVVDTYVPSVRNATGSFSGNADLADIGQNALASALLNATSVRLRLMENATKYWLIGTAYITGMSEGVSVKGKGEVSFTFQASTEATYN